MQQLQMMMQKFPPGTISVMVRRNKWSVRCNKWWNYISNSNRRMSDWPQWHWDQVSQTSFRIVSWTWLNCWLQRPVACPEKQQKRLLWWGRETKQCSNFLKWEPLTAKLQEKKSDGITQRINSEECAQKLEQWLLEMNIIWGSLEEKI